jgi:hypothetical protein
MAQNTVVANRLGQLAGWNNITCRILGRDVIGISRVAYDYTEDNGYEFGAGKYPVGYSEGNHTATASIDLMQEEYIKIVGQLPSGKKITDIDPFDIVVSFEYKDKTITDVIRGCKFLNSGMDVSQGTRTIVRSFNLTCHSIDENV